MSLQWGVVMNALIFHLNTGKIGDWMIPTGKSDEEFKEVILRNRDEDQRAERTTKLPVTVHLPFIPARAVKMTSSSCTVRHTSFLVAKSREDGHEDAEKSLMEYTCSP